LVGFKGIANGFNPWALMPMSYPRPMNSVDVKRFGKFGIGEMVFSLNGNKSFN